MRKAIILIMLLIVVFSGCSNQPPVIENTTSTTENTTKPPTVKPIPEPESEPEDITEPPPIDENPFTVKLSYPNQCKNLYYKPKVSGIYRFDMSIDDVNKNYSIEIINSKKLSIRECSYSSYSNHGFTEYLNKDEEYTVKITQKEGDPECTITIGIPKEIQEIKNNHTSGKLEYIDQLDRYTFKSGIAGKYRFAFSTSDVNCKYKIRLYDEINEQQFSVYDSSYYRGRTIYLDANSEYKLEVEQDEGFVDYEINIFEPQAPIDVSDSFEGNIHFIEQENTYYYTPAQSGDYDISINYNDVEKHCSLKMVDSINQQIVSLSSNGYVRTVTLNAGETYTIVVEHNNGFVNYKVNIEPSTETE